MQGLHAMDTTEGWRRTIQESMPMLQQHICSETKAKLKEIEVSEVVAKMRLFVYDNIDKIEIKFGFEMAWLWWRRKPTPDGTYYGGIRIALSEIAYSLGIIMRGILK